MYIFLIHAPPTVMFTVTVTLVSLCLHTYLVHSDRCETALVLEMFVHTQSQGVQSEPVLCYSGNLKRRKNLDNFYVKPFYTCGLGIVIFIAGLD